MLRDQVYRDTGEILPNHATSYHQQYLTLQSARKLSHNQLHEELKKGQINTEKLKSTYVEPKLQKTIIRTFDKSVPQAKFTLPEPDSTRKYTKSHKPSTQQRTN